MAKIILSIECKHTKVQGKCNDSIIICRESALLVPEDEESRSSAEHIESVAEIISHELAHQWFGNLVTMKWWDDLWLKEGFATYMSYIALDTVSEGV